MTKLFKKSLALMLTLAICLSAMACCFIVSAEGETTPAGSISFVLNDEGDINPNDNVTIDVVADWTGVAGAEFTVTGLPSDATVATTNTEVVLNLDATAGTVKFVDGNNGELSDEAPLFSISFTAGEAGTLYNLAFADNSVFCDLNENDLVVSCNAASFTVVEKTPEHTHNYVATVTTQPTKDAEGVMTYECECGEGTYTEAIAKPVATTAVNFTGALNVSSVVGNEITLSTKQMRNTYGEDATYFIVVDYQKYGEGYVLKNATATLTAADRTEGGVSTANKDVILFADIALYEMTLDYTITAYFVNGDGVVVGYRSNTSSIAAMAAANAKQYSSNVKLLTALADMMNYGDAAQNYFANANPGTAICDAVLPSTVMGETYMAYASSTEGMPAAGEYNNDKSTTKLVSGTGFNCGAQTLNIGASNRIQCTLRVDNYDFENVVIKAHYEDDVYGYTEVIVTEDDLVIDGYTNAGYAKYTYYFSDLSIFACDKTVTIDMYYNGTLECTSVYSLGNFVNANINNSSLNSILTAMELFANSVGVQLGLDARW